MALDGKTGGVEEFVITDLIVVENEKILFIVESKQGSIQKAGKQCFLAMKEQETLEKEIKYTDLQQVERHGR